MSLLAGLLMGKICQKFGRSKIGLVVIMGSACVLAVRSDNKWKDGGVFAMWIGVRCKGRCSPCDGGD